MPTSRLILVASLLLVSGACSSEPCDGVMVGSQCIPFGEDVLSDVDATPIACVDDEQCLPLSVCIDGHCDRQCTAGYECPDGQDCVKYRCVDPNAPADIVDIPEKDHANQVPCTSHVQCADLEMACIDGYCDRECTEDWHCDDPELRCEYYRCVEAEPLPDVIEDLTADNTPEDLGEELPPGCEEKDGQYGETCLCSKACESELCVPNKLGSGRCTVQCNTNNDCPGTDICVQVQKDATSFISVCVPNDSGQLIPCDEAQRDPLQDTCYSGQYLQNQIGQCACATTCIGGSDCPEGTACGIMNGQKYCILVGGLCDQAAQCFGVCAGMGTSGFCTSICASTNDCPVGWTCQPVQEGVLVCSP